MANERFTDLPVVATSQMDDIICAVQGYQNPTLIGVSVQETLGQIFQLFQSNVILSYPGNPNGNLAGMLNQLCWDTVGLDLWICIVAGNEFTAQWDKVINLSEGPGIAITQEGNTITISATETGILWNNTTTTPIIMAVANGYKVNTGGATSLLLPPTSVFGDEINIMGFTGSWTINQGAGQNVIIGSIQSTVGPGGSVSSTNQYDSVTLVCMQDNLTWQCLGAPQGNLLIV